MTRWKTLMVATALGLTAIAHPAYAVPLSLVSQVNDLNTATCVYAGNPGLCSGIGTPAVLPGGSATNFLSAAYTVGDLTGASSNHFQVDIRVIQNDTSILTLTQFELFIDGVSEFQLAGTHQLLDTQPSSKSEYAITGFNLSGFGAGQTAQFHITYTGENAGPEVYFLQHVPEPTTVLLMGVGFLGLGVWRRYSKKSAGEAI